MFIEGVGIWALEAKMEEKGLRKGHRVRREGETKITTLKGQIFSQMKD